MRQDARGSRWLWVIVLVGLSLRLGWGLSRPTDDTSIESLPDQREYLEAARNLRSGEGLGFTDPRFADRVVAYRTPGYPVFLAACAGSVRVARVAQAFVDAGTILAVYLIARRWLNSNRALFAAAIVALNPFLIYFSGLLLTETLFTAMVAWGLLLLLSRATIRWLLGGAILALSILVRPGAVAIPILLGIFAEMQNLRGSDATRRWWKLPVGATMLLLTLATITPWAYRNYRVLGEWVWTSTNGGVTSYDGWNADATGASDQRFIARMPQLRTMGEVGRSDYLAELARAFVRDYPGRAIELAGLKIARTWSPVPLSAEFSRPAYVAVGLAYSLPLDLLVLYGLVVSVLPRRARVLLILPALYLTFGAAMTVGSLRYRVPGEVAMAVIAAGVWVSQDKTMPSSRLLDEAVGVPV